MPSPKNILLVNPWIYDFTAYDYWLRPLGFLSLASIVRKYTACRLSFIDCLDRHHPRLKTRLKSRIDGRGAYPKEEVAKPAVLSRVPRRYSRYGIPVPLFEEELDRCPRPDLVLMTCTMTYWYPGVELAVDLIRRKFGAVPIILGGIYATIAAGHAKNLSGADIVLEGAGENKILPLLNQILGDGVAAEADFPTPDDLPLPAFDLLRNREGLGLLTSRGCPFRCTFCAGHLLFGSFVQRRPESVVDEVKTHHRLYGTRHFAFFDDALLLNKEKHIVPILEAIVRTGLPLNFHVPNGLQIRGMDDELASLFRKARVRSLFLSQESVDEELLARACPDKVGPGDLERALISLEKAGYETKDIGVYLIIGLPGQDPQTVSESIRHVQRLGARPKLTFFSPVPGTVEWERLIREGHLPPDADPLLHNKLTFPYLWGNFSSREFESLCRLLVE